MPPPRRILIDHHDDFSLLPNSSTNLDSLSFGLYQSNQPNVIDRRGGDVLEPGPDQGEHGTGGAGGSSGGGTGGWTNTGGDPQTGTQGRVVDTSGVHTGVINKGAGGVGPDTDPEIEAAKQHEILYNSIRNSIEGLLSLATVILYRRALYKPSSGLDPFAVMQLEEDLKSYKTAIEVILTGLDGSELKSILDKISFIDVTLGMVGNLMGEGGIVGLAGEWFLTSIGLEALAALAGPALAAAWEFLMVVLALIAIYLIVDQLVGPAITKLINWMAKQLKILFKWTDDQINQLELVLGSYEKKLLELYTPH